MLEIKWAKTEFNEANTIGRGSKYVSARVIGRSEEFSKNRGQSEKL